MYHYTTIVTVLAIFFYLFTSIRVSALRYRTKVMAPAVSGHPLFERAFRVQMNTLEWMPIFLPGLWLFAIYVSDVVASLLGLVWIAGRVVYMQAYMGDAQKRAPGYVIQAIAALFLLIGGLVGAIAPMIHG